MKKDNKEQEFVISRKEWDRPAFGERKSCLLFDPESGRSCCIGLYYQSRGVSKDELAEIGEPCELLFESIPKESHWLLRQYNMQDCDHDFDNSKKALNLMGKNDDNQLYAKDKERSIKKIFKEAGVKVTFIA